MTAAQLNTAWGEAVVRQLCRLGAHHFVVSPGSRNTPLVLAVENAARMAPETAHVHRHIDERGAGFFALGLARVTGKPAVLICTSGSAGTHYYPAVVEASQARIPLVILTADRPPELQSCGALQTIGQAELFGSHVRDSVDLGPASLRHSNDLDWQRTQLAAVYDSAVGTHPGPVHINCPAREPLWEPGLVVEPDVDVRQPTIVRGPVTLSDATLCQFAEELMTSPRGAFVVGPAFGGSSLSAGDTLAHRLGVLAERLGWPIIAEPSSLVRFHPETASHVVGAADLILRTKKMADAFRPDVIVRFGQTPTSKPIQKWMATAAKRVVLVDPSGQWNDPDHVASSLLVAECDWLCEQVELRLAERNVKADSTWLSGWHRALGVVTETVDTMCGDSWWQGAAIRAAIKDLPEATAVHVANSMPIRDLDSLAPHTTRRLPVFANRGANGIDGMVATALGEATALAPTPLLVLSGDLSLLHDIGSLMVARQRTARCTVVVFDNGGGGIFDFLNIAQHQSTYEQSFVMKQPVDIPQIVRGMGVRCVEANCATTLRDAIRDDLERIGLGVVYVQLSREDNTAMHHRLWEAVDARLQAGDVL